MTKAQLGWLDLALLLPYSLVQVALSPLWDRAVPRVVVGVCLAAASVAMLLFCASPGFLFAAGCLFISGAAQVREKRYCRETCIFPPFDDFQKIVIYRGNGGKVPLPLVGE